MLAYKKHTPEKENQKNNGIYEGEREKNKIIKRIS